MISYLKQIINDIENTDFSISKWILSFGAITFIRFMLEALSSPTTSGIIPSDPYTLIHYELFWVTLTLGVILIVGHFAKNYIKTARLALFGLPIIWLAPILDIIISRGSGYTQLYIFDTGRKLVTDFITFFGPNLASGATYGMRIEMVMVLVGIYIYVFSKTRKTLDGLLAVLATYVWGFFLASLPGIIYTISNSFSTVPPSQVVNWLEKVIYHSNIFHNTLHDGSSSVKASRFLELVFDKFMSQILFIISCALGTALFYKISRAQFFAIIKNARVERVNFYIFSLLCGMGFAYINMLGSSFSIIDLLGVICLVVAWASLWMHAVHTNDLVDVEIDKISNTERPLVKKDVSQETMRETGHVWLTMALLGSWVAGFYPFYMSLAYISASYVYSVPPIRLRRFPIIPSFLIGVACLATILAGFFFVSVNKDIHAFPIFLACGIVIMVTLAINFKDLKDVEGDRAQGVITLATIFDKKAPKIIGWCMAISILLVPVFLSFYLLFVFAIPTAVIGYRIINSVPYKEKNIFILRFVFLSLIGLSYLLIFWLGHVYKII